MTSEKKTSSKPALEGIAGAMNGTAATDGTKLPLVEEDVVEIEPAV